MQMLAWFEVGVSIETNLCADSKQSQLKCDSSAGPLTELSPVGRRSGVWKPRWVKCFATSISVFVELDRRAKKRRLPTPVRAELIGRHTNLGPGIYRGSPAVSGPGRVPDIKSAVTAGAVRRHVQALVVRIGDGAAIV